MFDPNAPGDIVDMPDDVLERCVFILLTVGPQKANVKVDTHQPPSLADGVQLCVGQVPGRGAQRVHARVGGDQGGIRDVGHVPKPFLVQMRDVDQNAELVAATDQRLPGAGQTRSGVGRAGKDKGDAMAKGVGPAPHNAQRTKPCLVKDEEGIQVGVDRFCALKVQDGGEDAILKTGRKLVNRAHDS